jgi:hypothetical protein
MTQKNTNDESWNECSCGQHLLQGDHLIDTVYPCNREKTVFNAYCDVSIGGCGRTVYADNISTLLKRWNMGAIDENSEDSTFSCLQCIIESIAIFNKNKEINSDLFHAFPLVVHFNKNDNRTCKHKKE